MFRSPFLACCLVTKCFFVKSLSLLWMCYSCPFCKRRGDELVGLGIIYFRSITFKSGVINFCEFARPINAWRKQEKKKKKKNGGGVGREESTWLTGVAVGSVSDAWGQMWSFPDTDLWGVTSALQMRLTLKLIRACKQLLWRAMKWANAGQPPGWLTFCIESFIKSHSGWN